MTIDPEYAPDPPRFSAEELTQINALSEEDIVAAAEADPDNPPWTDAQLVRGLFAREVRRARVKVGRSQESFAAALGLPIGTLRNWEQGRFDPDPAARALIRLVSRDPEHALKVLAGSPRQEGNGPHLWAQMQANHDLWQTEREETERD